WASRRSPGNGCPTVDAALIAATTAMETSGITPSATNAIAPNTVPQGPERVPPSLGSIPPDSTFYGLGDLPWRDLGAETGRLGGGDIARVKPKAAIGANRNW